MSLVLDSARWQARSPAEISSHLGHQRYQETTIMAQQHRHSMQPAGSGGGGPGGAAARQHDFLSKSEQQGAGAGTAAAGNHQFMPTGFVGASHAGLPYQAAGRPADPRHFGMHPSMGMHSAQSFASAIPSADSNNGPSSGGGSEAWREEQSQSAHGGMPSTTMPSGGDETDATGGGEETAEEERAPRPPNSWILYRAAKSPEVRKSMMQDNQTVQAMSSRQRQAEISKRVSHMWKNETKAVKDAYAALASERREDHRIKYPVRTITPRARPTWCTDQLSSPVARITATGHADAQQRPTSRNRPKRQRRARVRAPQRAGRTRAVCRVAQARGTPTRTAAGGTRSPLPVRRRRHRGCAIGNAANRCRRPCHREWVLGTCSSSHRTRTLPPVILTTPVRHTPKALRRTWRRSTVVRRSRRALGRAFTMHNRAAIIPPTTGVTCCRISSSPVRPTLRTSRQTRARRWACASIAQVELCRIPALETAARARRWIARHRGSARWAAHRNSAERDSRMRTCSLSTKALLRSNSIHPIYPDLLIFQVFTTRLNIRTAAILAGSLLTSLRPMSCALHVSQAYSRNVDWFELTSSRTQMVEP